MEAFRYFPGLGKKNGHDGAMQSAVKNSSGGSPSGLALLLVAHVVVSRMRAFAQRDEARPVIRVDSQISKTPLANEALATWDQGGQVLLAAVLLNQEFDGAHGLNNSAPNTLCNSGAISYAGGGAPTVPLMGTPKDKKRAKPTEADKLAAARLRALLENHNQDRMLRKEKKLTQQDIIDAWDPGATDPITQGLVSQYMTGTTALNFLAVLRFARILNCQPEDIRDDLPEQAELATRGRQWPFQRISPVVWESLDTFDRAAVERAAQKELLDLQQGRPPMDTEARGPLQRRRS